MPCPSCPNAPIEYDGATGSSYCTICGTVLEESTITSELNFVEGGDGSSRMVGQFVSAERSGLRSLNMRNRRMNTGQSREETIANARRKFQEVAIALRGLGEYHIERAVQCYKLALMHGFTNGRKQAHVIAACLYTVCRQEKTSHMLIDFSDVLHTNVFALGCAFLKLIRILNIRLPLIDPSLYLARFAAQMDLGDKTHAVTNDALRLVQRMKRDWIHYGRRPSGICGACLLIAARMHGFNKNQAEVVRIVKICEATLKKRLDEFSKTASGKLSIDEFRSRDINEEANPPCFRSNIVAIDKSSTSDNVEDDEDRTLSQEITSVINSSDMQKLNINVPYSRTWIDRPVDENPDNWNDISESELEQFLLTTEEMEIKKSRWEENNRDWIALQAAKLLREKETEGDKRKKKTTKKRTTNSSSISTAKNPKEMITKRLAPVISKKINYAALDQIFE